MTRTVLAEDLAPGTKVLGQKGVFVVRRVSVGRSKVWITWKDDRQVPSRLPRGQEVTITSNV